MHSSTTITTIIILVTFFFYYANNVVLPLMVTWHTVAIEIYSCFSESERSAVLAVSPTYLVCSVQPLEGSRYVVQVLSLAVICVL